MPRPLPWSFSSLDKFVSCPKAFHEIRVVKSVVEPEGEAARWGTTVHEAIEASLKDNVPVTRTIPDAYGARLQEYVEAIRGRPGKMLVEHSMALNKALEPVGFFDPTCWVRGKADVVHLLEDKQEVHALDHKTGKKKHTRQMMLMALLLFYHFPWTQQVRTGFFWLKSEELTTEHFTRDDIPRMWDEFMGDLKQYREAFLTDTWQPRQSGLCHGWCAVTSCEYWRPKRLR